jgi:transposase-like protein
MKKKPTNYTPEFKAKVVKDFIKADRTQAEICSQYGITSNSLQRWHSEFLEGVEAIFTKGKVEKAHKEELSEKEKKLDEAYREIGSLTTQLNWLKKKCNEFGVKH